MSISAEDRRHLLEQLEQVTDERAARTMSPFGSNEQGVDTPQHRGGHRCSPLVCDMSAPMRTEVTAAIAYQRTVIFGMLAYLISLFAMAVMLALLM